MLKSLTLWKELRSKKDTVDASIGLPRQNVPPHEGQPEPGLCFLVKRVLENKTMLNCSLKILCIFKSG